MLVGVRYLNLEGHTNYLGKQKISVYFQPSYFIVLSSPHEDRHYPLTVRTRLSGHIHDVESKEPF